MDAVAVWNRRSRRRHRQVVGQRVACAVCSCFIAASVLTALGGTTSQGSLGMPQAWDEELEEGGDTHEVRGGAGDPVSDARWLRKKLRLVRSWRSKIGKKGALSVGGVRQRMQAARQTMKGTWEDLREHACMFSWLHEAEAPLWKMWRRMRPKSKHVWLTELRAELDGRPDSWWRESRRLRRALDLVCDVLVHVKLRSSREECPEAFVSELRPRGRWTVASHSQVWAMAIDDFVTLEGSSKQVRRPRSVIVMHPDLIHRLSDEELRALLGLHMGRLMMGVTLPRVWKFGPWWLLHRTYMGHQELWDGLLSWLDHTGMRRHSWRNNPLRRLFFRPAQRKGDKSRATVISIMRDAGALQVADFLGRVRNAALVKDADRFAVVAGGSVEVARAAARKAMDDFHEETLPWIDRHGHMLDWASTPVGRRLVSESQARFQMWQVCSTGLMPLSPLRLLLTAFAALTVALCVLWLEGSSAAVMLSLLLVARAVGAAVFAAGRAWQITSVGDILAGSDWLREALEMRSSAFLALFMYCLGAGLSWWRHRQIKAKGKHTTVESMIQEALPAAAEASAGAALLARCTAEVQHRTLGELDRELRIQWTTALRGLSAKLADLRRLAGAGDAGSARDTAGRPVSPSSQLCWKLETEVREALGAELMWIKRALDLDNDGALERALFWWLHDDGEGGAWGAPSPATSVGHLGGDTPTMLEKLPYPSLSAAGISGEQLKASRPPDYEERASEMAKVATSLTEQYQQLDQLRTSLRSTTPGPLDDFDTSSWKTMVTAAWEGLSSGGSPHARADSAVRTFLHSCEVGAPGTSPCQRQGGSAHGSHRSSRRSSEGVVKFSPRQPPGRSPGASVVAGSSFEAPPVAKARLATTAARWVEALRDLVACTVRPSGSYERCWEVAFPLILIATCAGARAHWLGEGSLRMPYSVQWWSSMVEFLLFLYANWALWRHLQELRLPCLWARLERCMATLEAERDQLVKPITSRLLEQSRPDRLAHLKALVLTQGIRTAQNLDYFALSVHAEALRSAAALDFRGAATPTSSSSAAALKSYSSCQAMPRDHIHRCLQLLYAIIPRHGRRGQRQVSSDADIHEAMAWFDLQPMAVTPGGSGSEQSPGLPTPARLRSLQVALATSQRHLWMLLRLCDVRAMARPLSVQGTLAALLDCQLRPIVSERRLRLDSLPSVLEHAEPAAALSRSNQSTSGSGRILGDLESTTGRSESGDGDDDESSACSGTVRRILASSDGSPEEAAAEDEGDVIDARSEDSHDSAESYSSACSSIAADGGMQRILAASEASDGASSDSASSAGFNSGYLGLVGSSLWSGASSSSSLTEDLLTHRRPLLEGYASALRPLFMTRGDLMHLLANFPAPVLQGGAVAGARGFAAHRELLAELFGSLVIAVKSPERRGKVKLAFGEGFTYGREKYVLGHTETTLQLIAHGVKRTGHEMFPVINEEAPGDEEKSEAAVSAARDNNADGGLGGVLEFEELVVPMTEVSSRELFLAELLQSDQCQLLAGLSQGSHSKYGQRSLRRRRRTLRHVREATQLLVNVPK